MALNLDKLVEDAKRSGSAKEAVVFIVQNIAMLINDAAGDQNRGAELYKEINARAQDLANSVVDNRDVQPVAPHEDAHDTSVHRTDPTQPTLTGASVPPRQGDVPKPRLDPRTNPAEPKSDETKAEMEEGKKAAHSHASHSHTTKHR